jgi:hypothetical protein
MYLFKSQFSVLLGIYLELDLPGHVVILCNFFENHILFSTAAAPFCLLPSNVQGLQSLHIFADTYYICFLLC